MIKTDRSLGNQPAFYLAYLAFYFIPWLQSPPETKDVVAIIIALALFVPIFFHAHKQEGRKSLPHIIAISIISMVLAPFHGTNGVFHIYAVVQAGFLRPERFAWIVVFAVSAVYLAFSLLIDQGWWDNVFPLFMGFIITVGVISSAGQMEKQRLMERTRQYDKQMAALSERERIAQDLHDVLGQTLTMVTLKTELANKLIDRDPTQAKQELNEVLKASRGALDDIRETVSGMNATSAVKEIQRAKSILESAGIELSINGNIPSLNAASDHVIGLAIREAITNVVRHATASRATLSWEELEQSVKVSVSDNGSLNNFIEGSGLRGMRKRLEKIDGELLISANSGMQLTIMVPKL